MPRVLKPRMLVGGVIDDQLGDHADPRAGASRTSWRKSSNGAVFRVDAEVVGDVVAIVRATGDG